MKTIEQRNEYIRSKSLKLNQITEAHKHTRRLARIAIYQLLLTEMVSNHVKNELKHVFKK